MMILLKEAKEWLSMTKFGVYGPFFFGFNFFLIKMGLFFCIQIAGKMVFLEDHNSQSYSEPLRAPS